MRKKDFLIYGLVDPITGQLRYIGRSCSGLRRPRRHTIPSELAKDQTHKGRWLRSLDTARPQIVVIQQLPDSELLNEAERFWIAYFRQLGCPLTNLTDGGEGTAGINKGRKRPDLVSLNRSRAGRPLSDSHKLKISQTHKSIGMKPPRELRKNLSFTAEQLQRLRPIWGAKPVVCSNGHQYPSVNAAAKDLGLWQQNINAVLRGRLRSTGGLSFWYLSDFGAK